MWFVDANAPNWIAGYRCDLTAWGEPDQGVVNAKFMLSRRVSPRQIVNAYCEIDLNVSSGTVTYIPPINPKFDSSYSKDINSIEISGFVEAYQNEIIKLFKHILARKVDLV